MAEKTEKISIRVTEQEKQLITSTAEANSLPVASYVRNKALAVSTSKLSYPGIVIKGGTLQLLDTHKHDTAVDRLDTLVARLNKATSSVVHPYMARYNQLEYWNNSLVVLSIGTRAKAEAMLRELTARHKFADSDTSDTLVKYYLKQKDPIAPELEPLVTLFTEVLGYPQLDRQTITYSQTKFSYDKQEVERIYTAEVVLDKKYLEKMWETLCDEDLFATHFITLDRSTSLPNYKLDLYNAYAYNGFSLKGIDSTKVFRFMAKFKNYHFKS